MRYTSAIASTLLVALGTPGVLAQEQPLVVIGKPLTLVSWSKGVTKQLEKNLEYPGFIREIPSRIAAVSFSSSASGLPVAVALSHSSGDKSLDRAAMHSVARIKTLQPMPASFEADQKFIAYILFAADQDEYDRQMSKLRLDAARRNTAHPDDKQPIALNIVSSSQPET